MAAELKNIANIQDIEGRHSRTTNLGSGTATCYGSDGPLLDPIAPARQQAEPVPPAKPTPLYFTKTFEIRLLGSEVQRNSIAMPVLPGYRIIVATDRVRTFVTRGAALGAASNLIGGVEVSAAWRTGTPPELDALVCTAQATDFGPDDLVVVGVDVTVFLLPHSDAPR